MYIYIYIYIYIAYELCYTTQNNSDIYRVRHLTLTHFDLAVVLVWVVREVADTGGWVPCGLGFSEQWNVGPCGSTYFVWNSSC